MDTSTCKVIDILVGNKGKLCQNTFIFSVKLMRSLRVCEEGCGGMGGIRS